MESVVKLLAKRGKLRVPVRKAAEIVWALASPDVGRMFCDVRGWTTKEYAGWLERTLTESLLDS
jgi:hypothetical protein